jgi:hypothetical protein
VMGVQKMQIEREERKLPKRKFGRHEGRHRREREGGNVEGGGGRASSKAIKSCQRITNVFPIRVLFLLCKPLLALLDVFIQEKGHVADDKCEDDLCEEL